MPRKLKTYITAIGFFDLAVAAPSMKAALEAWGAQQNLFHQGLAEETEDPDIVAATMAAPGVVLRRAVGTRNPFAQKAALPTSLPADGQPRRAKARPRAARKTKLPDKTHKAAIIEFEKEKAKRDRQREKEDAQRCKEEAAEEKAEEQREKKAARAQAILDRARGRHAEKMRQLEQERQVADDRLEAERARWEREESGLQDDVRKARR